MSYENIFDKSYERALQANIDGNDIFDDFYVRFINASPEVRQKFSKTDMPHQKRMLRKSFYSLLVFYGSNSADDYLNKMVEKHNALGAHIPHAMYDLWLDCLVESVQVYDPEYTPEVGLAWRLVLSSGITYMKYKSA